MFVGDAGRYSAFIAAGFLIYILIVFLIQAYFVLNPNYFHEEHRLLFRYHMVSDLGLFSDDYIASFVAAFDQPYLYELMTRVWLWAGGDLIISHRLLSFICWLAFLAGVAVVARRLGDRITVLGALGLTVAQPIYLHQITSSLPHAFAFPLLIWALVALIRGSALGLATVTVLSSLLYLAVTPVLGLALAWHVFVSQRSLFKENSVRLKSLLLVGVTGLVAVWLVAENLNETDQFGAKIEPTQQAETYPENGPQGRHFYGVFNPVKYVLAKAVTQFKTVLGPATLFVLLVYCLFGIVGYFSLKRGSKYRKGVFAFLLSSVVVSALIFFAKPYYLYRFILYPSFTILPLLFVLGLQQSCIRLKRFVRAPKIMTMAILALTMLSLDSFNLQKLGFLWHTEGESRDLLTFAADQPPRTLFAAWPGLETTVELIPYVARRPMFVMRKAHYPAYEKYIMAMRERMNALIDAYLATDPAALRTLHCRWGVDYLIVNKAHFAQDDSRPRYFAPFDDRIERIWRGNNKEDFLLHNPDAGMVALDTESFFILDLKSVGATGAGKTVTGCE